MDHNILDGSFGEEYSKNRNLNSNKPQLRERPPRNLNMFTKLTLLNGGLLTQMGWAFMGLGLIFTWIFVGQSEAKYWLSFDGSWEETSGIVQEIHTTGAEVNGRDVFRYVFSYSVGSENFSGTSYSSGSEARNLRMNDMVTVKYKSGNYERAKIEGMTTEMFPSWIAFVLIFPFLGFFMLLGGLYGGKQMINLLVNGKFTHGKYLSRKDSGSRVNQRTVWAYEFTFEVNNQSYIAKCQTHKTHLVEDEEKEIILYMPDKPEESTVFDAIPGVPSIDRMGKLEAAPTSSAKYLILPVLAIVVNVIIAFFMF
ncbi:MAG: DUF3592 domain-containing protein [Aureispira sp.]|nr:DUF3592 domain-containing protein [Aureispira sp.]